MQLRTSVISGHGCTFVIACYRIVPSKRSQLKHQKLRVGGYTEKVLEWSNIPVQGPTPDAKGIKHLVNKVGTVKVLCEMKIRQ